MVDFPVPELKPTAQVAKTLNEVKNITEVLTPIFIIKDVEQHVENNLKLYDTVPISSNKDHKVFQIISGKDDMYILFDVYAYLNLNLKFEGYTSIPTEEDGRKVYKLCATFSRD